MALRRRMLLAAVTGTSIVLTAACGANATPAATGSGAAAAAARPGGGIPRSPGPQPQTLSETGSTLLFPLFQAWARAYHQRYPRVSVRTAATGSGAGIAGASGGSVQFGASDAYLSSGDLVAKPDLLNVPLAISAQQVDYNLPGIGRGTHLKLNGAVLAQMYEGKIATWNAPAIAALNPGVHLPGTAVVPLHRSDSSGDTFLFTSYLATHDPGWNSAIGYGTTVAWPRVPAARAAHGNSGMVAGCRTVPGCVAYVGISYLSQALAGGLGEARLANESGQYLLPTAASMRAAVASFVSSTPTNETISMVNGPAAAGYPIVNYEYAIVASRQPNVAVARDIKAFLGWAVTTGNSAQFLGRVRFQPLPGQVVSLSEAQIAKIG